MPRTWLLVALVLAPALAAGCVGGAGAGVVAVPLLTLQSAAPGGVTEFVLALRSDRPAEVPLSVVVTPLGWSASLEHDRVRVTPEGTTAILTVRPPEDAAHGLHFVWVRAGPRELAVGVEVRDVGETPLRPGLGALVRTVGVWDNGTVFYTNMKEVRDNTGLRFVHLSGEEPPEESYAPIKVYVGGRRGERPPEPYNTSGYVPVIEGFDARLRGMREGEVRAVRIPPELAYTLPGNEEHVLYGDALTFVIEVQRVDDLGPEPGCGLPLCPPVRRSAGAASHILLGNAP